MQQLQSLLDWFAGDGRYMNLIHCMGHDTFWIITTVVLDLAIASGYCMIAAHWWRNQRLLPSTPAKLALGRMRNIFVFCGLCGYLFIPIKMVWPAWRLYDLFAIVLAYYTWRYALGAKDLKVVYSELGRSMRLQEELDASRAESKKKTFFLNAVSHDLRTPLNGIVLQAELAELQALSGDEPAVRTALDQVKSSARIASQLLDTLLEYARVDAEADQPTLSTFALADVMSGLEQTFGPIAAEKGLALVVNAPPGLLMRSDRRRIERILNNLVDNAMKFTRSGSVRIETQAAREGVEIHVIDTGEGIAPADRPRLFEPFFQAQNHERDRQKGFGLGLAIARRLSQQLGGDLLVESASGAGSRFSLVLPTTTPAESAESTDREPDPALTG